MKKITIKDLYAGKPDAKDEINFDGLDTFIKTFVVAEHFNLNSLIKGTHCFITGFKGTGKTALLFYLDDLLKNQDGSTCSSFVLFKEDFADTKRSKLQSLSNRILSSVTVENGALINSSEFEYIWRWILLKQIVNDNEYYGGNLFVNNQEWEDFKKKVNQIKDPQNARKIRLANKVKMAFTYKDLSTMSESTPSIEVDFQKTDSENYQKFLNLIDEAEILLASVTRTDIPYYIFVDELEAYYGETEVFIRDLSMIRDLVFTVKRINSIFASAAMANTKIICSVRSEILNAISRFIVPKEINKITSGFSVPLIWNYSNDNSYAHPIIQILLKRIAVCSEIEYDGKGFDIYKQWFPEQIHDVETASYILNNSWCKPRDIVRLISTAQSGLHNTAAYFSQGVFDASSKTYSAESLQEIKEELRALYTAEEIDDIVTCFTGYRTTFSVSDIKNRIESSFKDSILNIKFRQVMEDLYRLGFLGNYLPVSKTFRWQHKGDAQVILTDEWRLCIHYGLHNALSVGKRFNKALTRGVEAQIGDVADFIVTDVGTAFARGEFEINGISYKGSLHVSKFGKIGHGYIRKLCTVVNDGDKFKVTLLRYNEKYSLWDLDILSPIKSNSKVNDKLYIPLGEISSSCK